MKISELSGKSGVPVPTIKYYLREGILPRGDKAAANQSDYAESHVERLKLVKVMREVGGLSIEAIRRITRALDSEASPYDIMAITHFALSHRPEQEPARTPEEAGQLQEASREILRKLADQGWLIHPRSPAFLDVVDAYVAAKKAWPEEGASLSVDDLLVYARAAQEVASAEMAPGTLVQLEDQPLVSLRAMILGTVLFEPILLALRRLAQQDRAAKMLGADKMPATWPDAADFAPVTG